MAGVPLSWVLGEITLRSSFVNSVGLEDTHLLSRGQGLQDTHGKPRTAGGTAQASQQLVVVLMRCLCKKTARTANREDGSRGRFWAASNTWHYSIEPFVDSGPITGVAAPVEAPRRLRVRAAAGGPEQHLGSDGPKRPNPLLGCRRRPTG